MNTLPATLQDRVRERIDGAIAELITPEEISRLVAAGVDGFMQTKLQPMIQAEIEVRFRETIKAELQKPEYNGTWNAEVGAGVPALVREVMIKAAPEMFTAMIESMASQVFQRMRHNPY